MSMMTGETANDRSVLAVTGADRVVFLQGLVTNDVERVSQALVYAALLSPQGKYLADFFLFAHGDSILIDVKSTLADTLVRRLSMYRLRADVAIAPSPLHVLRGVGPAPEGAFADPRHPTLGWRSYTEADGTAPAIDWDALRVAACVPETGIELVPDDSYILEAGFERLNGVDFRKGCYVGQEVTARMKHRTDLKKGLVRVRVDGDAAEGTEITEITSLGKAAGRLLTRSGDRAIAWLRLDRAEDMVAGAARITLSP